MSNTSWTPPVWYCRRCYQTIPNRNRPFLSFCGANMYLLKRSRPNKKFSVSLLWIIVREINNDNYNNISRVMKYIQGTIVNRQVWKNKVACWCSICGAQGYVDPHWWFHNHGNRRSICPIQPKKTEHQEFNLGRAFQSGQCTNTGDMNPILTERSRIQYPQICYTSR